MKTLVALDIVNPFTKEIKFEGLRELVKRCNDYNCYNKVGFNFYTIEGILEGKEPMMENFTDYVVDWLNHIDGLRQTKKNIGFTLDLSNT